MNPFICFRDRCSHCRKLAPTWKALAEYHKDNVDITVAKVQSLIKLVVNSLELGWSVLAGDGNCNITCISEVVLIV